MSLPIKSTKRIIFTGLLIAIGILFSTVLHIIPTNLPGSMFSPLHLPVFICAIICGRRYGIVCGLLMPYISFLTMGMPPIYPVAIAMSIELIVYAAVCATVFNFNWFKDNIMIRAFFSILIAQLIGRFAGGISTALLLGYGGKEYLFSTFVVSYFINTWIAIVIQLVIIPPIVKKTNEYLLFREKTTYTNSQ
ncbi:MAG: ECF transporter S component [Clostridiaceae bacterium]|nr:ECF transporter S component [Clostridiaceae bacterium]